MRALMIGQKPLFYQSIKHRKSFFYCFSPLYLWSIFLLEMAKNIFDEEICDLVLCEAAESCEDEVKVINKEVKTVKKFVDLGALLFLLAACTI